MNTEVQDQKPDTESILIDLALESWRFAKSFERAIRKLDAGQAGRFTSQYSYFIKRLKEELAKAGFNLVDASGQAFEPGMAVSALNIEDFDAEDTLLIDQMVEPIIMGPDGLLRSGTVMLRKIEL